MISIRNATSADAVDIARTEAKYIDCPWTVAQIENEIINDMACFVVAEVNGEYAGYLSGEITADECEISNIAVEERFRRRGVGRALFGGFLDKVRNRGTNTVFLLVRDDNAAAIRLYHTVGFSEVGKRKQYYGKGRDALIMRLNF